jgi:tRNA splicing endonuclease
MRAMEFTKREHIYVPRESLKKIEYEDIRSSSSEVVHQKLSSEAVYQKLTSSGAEDHQKLKIIGS